MKVDDVPVGTRIGRMYWDRVCKVWRVDVRVSGRLHQVRLGKVEAVGLEQWAALLQRMGYPPKPEGKHWWWNSWTQQWFQEVTVLPRSHHRRSRMRAWNRQRRLYERQKELDAKSLAKAETKRQALLAKTRREIDEYLKSMKYDKFVKGARELEPTLLEMRCVVTRQMVGPMRYHDETASWFCWIGVTQRKLVMLGQQKETAEKAWLLLKHSLEGGSRILLTALKARREQGGRDNTDGASPEA